MQWSYSLTYHIIFQICTILFILNRFPKLIYSKLMHNMLFGFTFRPFLLWKTWGFSAHALESSSTGWLRRQICFSFWGTNNAVKEWKVDFKEIYLIEFWIISISAVHTFHGCLFSASWVAQTEWKWKRGAGIWLGCTVRVLHTMLPFRTCCHGQNGAFPICRVSGPKLAHQHFFLPCQFISLNVC